MAAEPVAIYMSIRICNFVFHASSISYLNCTRQLNSNLPAHSRLNILIARESLNGTFGKIIMGNLSCNLIILITVAFFQQRPCVFDTQSPVSKLIYFFSTKTIALWKFTKFWNVSIRCNINIDFNTFTNSYCCGFYGVIFSVGNSYWKRSPRFCWCRRKRCKYDSKSRYFKDLPHLVSSSFKKLSKYSFVFVGVMIF